MDDEQVRGAWIHAHRATERYRTLIEVSQLLAGAEDASAARGMIEQLLGPAMARRDSTRADLRRVTGVDPPSDL